IDNSISNIDIMSEEEKQQLLIEWNDTECEWWWSSSSNLSSSLYENTNNTNVNIQNSKSTSLSSLLSSSSEILLPKKQALTVHELFEEQVKKTPDSIAIVFEDEQVSYRELNIRSN